VTPDQAKLLYNWYYNPGEVVRSYGFFINPYKQYTDAKFKHVFAFDGSYNLYVAQFSVYQKHIDEIFNLDDKREYGFIWTKDTPIIEFKFLETKNIQYLNRRLRPMCQRLVDYGLPPNSKITCDLVDLWHLTPALVLKNGATLRPPEEALLEYFK